MTQERVQKIDEKKYAELKRQVAKEGATAMAQRTGYSPRTLSAIKNSTNYDDWRTKRRETAARSRKRATASQSASVKPSNAQSVAPTQSVTAQPVKKPGHNQRPSGGETAFVTREQHDRELRNHTQLINRLLNLIETIERRLTSLEREDAAYKQADILIKDKQSKSFWQRFKDRF